MVHYDRSYQNDAAAASSTAHQRSAAADPPRTPKISAPSPALARRFEELAAQWREETRFHSAPTILFQHPAYREIIGFGEAVLPLLLGDITSDDALWFSALHAITGENPVPAEHRGDIPRMTEHWLAWGRQRGYVDG